MENYIFEDRILWYKLYIYGYIFYISISWLNKNLFYNSDYYVPGALRLTILYLIQNC